MLKLAYSFDIARIVCVMNVVAKTMNKVRFCLVYFVEVDLTETQRCG
jgi:hypothetical protein